MLHVIHDARWCNEAASGGGPDLSSFSDSSAVKLSFLAKLNSLLLSTRDVLPRASLRIPVRASGLTLTKVNATVACRHNNLPIPCKYELSLSKR